MAQRETPQFRVLIVDDDKTFTKDLSKFLSRQFETCVAFNEPEAITLVDSFKPDVVLLDITLETGREGIDVLKIIHAKEQAPEVIMLTGMKDTNTVVDSIKFGAFHYVIKPPLMSELINLINIAAMRTYDARKRAALESQVQRLGGKFIVHDPAMVNIMKDIERVSPTDATVMIIGESGTGKELVANHVHESSRRIGGPFVAINCGAISEHLMESELFGHVRGAFTGAERERAGCFEKAEGGTIFLDEIGHAPKSLQVKLLRVLEAREFQRVGSPDITPANVRIIAASSQDLKAAVSSGEFNEALYHRLNVFRIMLPPLRNRRKDIMPLAQHFLAIFSAQIGRRDLVFTPGAQEFLAESEWCGNVRELRNLMERVVILADDCLISAQHLAAEHHEWPAVMPRYDEAKDDVINRFQKSYLAKMMKDSGGNVTEAASQSGLARETFSNLVTKLGLRE